MGKHTGGKRWCLSGGLNERQEGSVWESEGAEGGSVVEARSDDAEMRGDLFPWKQELPLNTASV